MGSARDQGFTRVSRGDSGSEQRDDMATSVIERSLQLESTFWLPGAILFAPGSVGRQGLSWQFCCWSHSESLVGHFQMGVQRLARPREPLP